MFRLANCGGKKVKPQAAKRVLISSALLLFLFHCAVAFSAEVKVCFSPPLPGGCDPTATIVEIVKSARHQIRVQAYEFTSASIAKAIVDAHKRGLDVGVILDKSNLHEGYSAAKFLQNEGVPVAIDSVHNIAHNKVIIIDGGTVITGSFNFTKAAESTNAENVVVIADRGIAAEYLQNWNSHLSHSQALKISQNAVGASERSATASGQVIGNRKSQIYAWSGCGSYDTMAPQNRVTFASRQAAEAAGYRAARNCR
jgi:phosphatidylserine/phosphatidylglycerophosphate/cardiolipin synthase-like enzyme